MSKYGRHKFQRPSSGWGSYMRDAASALGGIGANPRVQTYLANQAKRVVADALEAGFGFGNVPTLTQTKNKKRKDVGIDSSSDQLPTIYVPCKRYSKHRAPYDYPLSNKRLTSYALVSPENECFYTQLNIGDLATLKARLQDELYALQTTYNTGTMVNEQTAQKIDMNKPPNDNFGPGDKTYHLRETLNLRIKNNGWFVSVGDPAVETSGVGSVYLEIIVVEFNRAATETYRSAVEQTIQDATNQSTSVDYDTNPLYDYTKHNNERSIKQKFRTLKKKSICLKPGQEIKIIVEANLILNPNANDVELMTYAKGSRILMIRQIGDIAHTANVPGDVGFDRSQVDCIERRYISTGVKDSHFKVKESPYLDLDVLVQPVADENVDK